MFSKGTRTLLALIQAIVGYEWLVSGANKVLSGQFPQGLAGTLTDSLKGNPNGWYVSFLRAVVLPHSVFYGYLIECAEVGIGLALLGGALLLIGRIPSRGERYYHLACIELGAAAVAAFACVVLCVNFHFFMGDGFVSALNPGQPFDEGIDLDTLLPPIAAIVCALNTRLLIWLIGDEVVRARLSRIAPLLASLHLPFARRETETQTA
jgi:thiosulfate dehydrogenase (quinone) large subunit